MFSPCHVSQLLYGKLMHRVLRSAGWLWPSLTQLRPDIRTFRRLPPEEAEQKPRGTDSASHTVIHQPSTPHTQHTHTLLLLLWRGGNGERWGVMELYGHGQSTSIHRAFYHPLIQRSGLLPATKSRGQGGVVRVRGGGWKTGKGFVKAWWGTTSGDDGSRPVSPVVKERL